jgi:hypothetical protein
MDNLGVWIGFVITLIGFFCIVVQIKSGELQKPVPPGSMSALSYRAASIGAIIFGIHLILTGCASH